MWILSSVAYAQVVASPCSLSVYASSDACDCLTGTAADFVAGVALDLVPAGIGGTCFDYPAIRPTQPTIDAALLKRGDRIAGSIGYTWDPTLPSLTVTQEDNVEYAWIFPQFPWFFLHLADGAVVTVDAHGGTVTEFDAWDQDGDGDDDLMVYVVGPTGPAVLWQVFLPAPPVVNLF